MNKIITLKVGAFFEEKAIYIGRPGKGNPGSVLKNPFPLAVDNPVERKKILRKFKTYLIEQIETNELVLKELKRLEQIAIDEGELLLGCFCRLPKKPDRLCHGDVIVDWLEKELMMKGYEVVILNQRDI